MTKILTALIVLLASTSYSFAEPADSGKLEDLKKFETKMTEMSVKMAFMLDFPLAESAAIAPELIMRNAYQAAQIDSALTDKAHFTVRAIGSKFREQADGFRSLKDLGLRQAAIEYAESISNMSDALAKHISKEDPSAIDLNSLISGVTKKREAVSKAFPLMEKK